MCIRDRITTDPQEVDAVVNRAWQLIYNGMSGCIKIAVDKFLATYNDCIGRFPEAEYIPVDASMAYDSFTRTKESASALDGWSPKELSMLSYQTCAAFAILFNQIEEGAQWPRSSLHALIAYLEKEGAEVGKVMSYRPLSLIHI